MNTEAQGSGERDRRAGVRRRSAFALLVCSIVVGLILLEIGCRLARGPQALLQWQNLVLKSRLEARMAHRAGMGPAYTHHSTLGFVNTPGYASPLVNHDAHGFRRMPLLPANAVQDPVILATGDSYTSGDEVADFDAWPARLQQIAGRRTVNAGVAAYGLDQTVLLTEQLVGQLRPGVLIVGFIADDVRRCEMKRMWGREKPYLAGEGSALELRNVPVPPPPDPHDTLSALEGALGWSVFVDTLFDRLPWTQEWHMDNARALPSGAGERLACPLMRRIAALGVPTLVVAQVPADRLGQCGVRRSGAPRREAGPRLRRAGGPADARPVSGLWRRRPRRRPRRRLPAMASQPARQPPRRQRNRPRVGAARHAALTGRRSTIGFGRCSLSAGWCWAA